MPLLPQSEALRTATSNAIHVWCSANEMTAQLISRLGREGHTADSW